MFPTPENTDRCARCGVPSRGKNCPCQHKMATGSTLLKASKTSTRPIQLGMILANCRILQPLGVGSSGTVYRGFHIVLNRAVAIKILTLTEANKEVQAERFLSEARAVSSIKHEHIVSIYDAGWSEGHCYIVMELVPGQSLSDFITSQETMSLNSFLSIARQCCLGLSAAHDAGVIHRDVKAQNILIDPSLRVKVCDFGLAQRVHGHPEFSRYRLISGTPTYMSPEQIRAQSVDPRSDIYSLGITFFEMLTGHPPFHQKTVREVMSAHLNQSPPILTPQRPDIPSTLAELIDQCLEKDPDLRPQSAKDILARLDSLQSRTKRIILPRKALKTGSSEFSSYVVGALIFLTLSIFAMSAHSERKQAKLEQQKALIQLKKAKQDAAKARRILSLLHRARHAVRRGYPSIQIEEFTETALTLSRNSYESLLVAANIYERAGLYEKSRLKLRQALEKRPPAYEALFYLHKLDSKSFPHQSQSPQLQQILGQSKQRNEINELTLFAQAAQEQRDGLRRAAIKTYSRLEKLSPRLPELFLNRGLLRVQFGDLNSALKDFNKAIAINEDFAEAYNNRGNLQLKLGKTALALQDFHRALSLEPQYYQALNNRGAAQELSGRYGLAEQDYNHALVIKPTFADAYLNRAGCRIRLCNFKGALEDCQKSQDLGLYNPTLAHTRGVAYQKLRQHKIALNAFHEALAGTTAKETQASILFDQALSLEALKDEAAAIEGYKKALTLTQNPALQSRAGDRLKNLQHR
ncbi:MAG: serine/threonine-protein kinase [Planctomycetota bacterium]|nr:serine/threonine-protein kinase [Planctomycetota bacterium]